MPSAIRSALAAAFLFALLGGAAKADDDACGAPLASAGGVPGRVVGVSLSPGSARPVLALAPDGSGAAEGVVLSGVIVPAVVPAAERARLLDRLAAYVGRDVTIRADAAVDRRGRLAGLVSDGDGRLLQSRLLEEGLVVADGANRPCPRLFFAAETLARRESRGIWHRPILITDGEDVSGLPDFVILSGRILSVGRAGRTVYLNFGAHYRTDPTVRVGAKETAELEAAGKSVDGLAGRLVEVRGWAERYQGLDIRLGGEAALRIVEDANDFETRRHRR